MEKMTKKKVLVFLDVSVDGDPFERMIFELFTDVAPKTAENFRALCTGEKGASLKTGKPLHYKGTFFHRIIKRYVAQGGDFLRQNGKYGESIYGGKFPDESPKLRHDGPGLLSMAIADRDERGSLFSITFEADHHLDRKNIVFGKLVEGDEVLKKIENAGDDEGRPAVLVKIVNSGEIHYDAKEGHKLKSGKEAVDDNNHKVKRKGKHKKLSKKRKRRRRYYTSESDSSTDTDTDSSESDTDSDSSASSLSDTSSSADDKRKRKRSKRDRHRHGKRKNKRHDKRHKRRDKKSKRKSKRNSVLDSESDSETGSGSHDDGAVGASNVKHKLSEVNQSLLVEQETPKVSHKKGEGAEISEREESEFPRENGDHQSNGIEVGMGSEQSASRHHYGVNDRPSKSRSRSLSPERTTSKSMRISPRTAGKGPGVGTNSRRSPSISRSPQQISGRSRSNTPVRSGSSRSPAMSKRRRSVSMSPPARSPSQRSRSRSATVSPPRRRVTRTPPRISSKRSSLRSASRSPPRSSRPSLSRSSGRPSRRTISRSPVTPSHRSVSRSSGRALPRRSPSRSPVRSSHRSVSRSSGRAPPRRSPSRSPVRSSHRSGSRSSGRSPPRRTPSRSPVRAPRKINRRSYSGSPVSAGRRERSPVSDRGRSSSRSPSVDGSPKRVRRGRGFSDRFSYVRRYRSRSPDRSPVRSYRYGGRTDRDRYSSYRRSPRRYRSPLRARTPPRFRGRRSRTRTPSVSRSPIRYRNRRYSRSPIRSRSPVRVVRRRSPSRSRSPSESRSLRNSRSPKRLDKGRPTKSSSGSPPPRKTGLVSYGDGSPDSDRN